MVTIKKIYINYCYRLSFSELLSHIFWKTNFFIIYCLGFNNRNQVAVTQRSKEKYFIIEGPEQNNRSKIIIAQR